MPWEDTDKIMLFYFIVLKYFPGFVLFLRLFYDSEPDGTVPYEGSNTTDFVHMVVVFSFSILDNISGDSLESQSIRIDEVLANSLYNVHTILFKSGSLFLP